MDLSDSPSFSLGIEFNLDTTPSPLANRVQGIDDDDDFETGTRIQGLLAQEPIPLLKRLRRGPSSHPSTGEKRKAASVFDSSPNVDDEIEEYSSQENLNSVRGEVSYPKNPPVCNSSKFPVRGHSVLTKQVVSKKKSRRFTPASNSFTSKNVEAGSDIFSFKSIAISPLRKFQLVDSDSDSDFDEPSATGDRNVVMKSEGSSLQKQSVSSSSKLSVHGYSERNIHSASKIMAPASSFLSSKNAEPLKNVHTSPLRKFQLFADQNVGSNITSASKMEHHLNPPSQSVLERQQMGGKVSINNFHNEDLWKDFVPKKSTNIQRLVLDELCEELIRPSKDHFTHQRKKNVCPTNSNGCFREQSITEIMEQYEHVHASLPPAYRYFYHDDQQIQRLTRSRLVNFLLIGTLENGENDQSDSAHIDYMRQFDQGENPTRSDAKISYKRRKNSRNMDTRVISEANNYPSTPKDAGKRRVHADGQSSGYWYTGLDGRKVYVSKTGQELAGQNAYRHYRKENGGFI